MTDVQKRTTSNRAGRATRTRRESGVQAVLRAGGWRRSGVFEIETSEIPEALLAVGEVVRVSAPGGAVVGRVTAARPGKANEVWVGLLDRQALRAAVGTAVQIAVMPAIELASAELRVGFEGQVLASQRFENQLRAWLIEGAEVLTAGRLARPDGHGLGRFLVQVVACQPEIGVVGPGTEIRVQYVSQLELIGLTSYADVGGLDDAIAELRRYAHGPLLTPEVYRQVGVTPPRGILLYGPPGTGKTHLARAAASELGVHCISVSGPELVGTKYGETEASLRKLFNEAMQSSPAVIVVDEIDALAPRRGASGAQADARIVTQILSLLDGLVALDGIVVLATTNRIEAVEPALRRPGRLDREIFVGPPDESARAEILAIHTRAMPLSTKARLGMMDVAARTPGFVGADLMALCREAGLAAIERIGGGLGSGQGKAALEVEPRDFERALQIVQPAGIRSAVARFDAPTWDAVWGLDDVKDELRSVAKESLRPTSPLAREGILLSGPSGSGKTVLAEGLAGELGANLVRLRGSDVFSKWLGESEQAVRETFELARHLRPTVLFIDHLDSLAPRRAGDKPEMASERVRNELLVELDDSANDGVLVIGATSALHLVDETIARPGRLGVHVAVPPPSAEERRQILEGYLRSFGFLPLRGGGHSDVVLQTEGWTPAELAMLVRRACATGQRAASGRDVERRMRELLEGRSPRALQEIESEEEEAI